MSAQGKAKRTVSWKPRLGWTRRLAVGGEGGKWAAREEAIIARRTRILAELDAELTDVRAAAEADIARCYTKNEITSAKRAARGGRNGIR